MPATTPWMAGETTSSKSRFRSRAASATPTDACAAALSSLAPTMAPSTDWRMDSRTLPPSSLEVRTAADTTSRMKGLPSLATARRPSMTLTTASRTKPVASPVISSAALIALDTAPTAILLAPSLKRPADEGEEAPKTAGADPRPSERLEPGIRALIFFHIFPNFMRRARGFQRTGELDGRRVSSRRPRLILDTV